MDAEPRDLAAEASDRDFNGELQLAFETNRNWLALHTALRVSYTHPVPESATPFPADMYCVPAWVLDACYAVITEKLKTASDGKGRTARWLTRYRAELKDQTRWKLFVWCREQGLSREEALGAAAEYLDEAEDTVEDAIERTEKRRERAQTHPELAELASTIAPVFEGPVPTPWQEEDPWNDPEIAKAMSNARRFEFFDQVVNAVRQSDRRQSDGKGDTAARVWRLLDHVAAAKNQGARLK